MKTILVTLLAITVPAFSIEAVAKDLAAASSEFVGGYDVYESPYGFGPYNGFGYGYGHGLGLPGLGYAGKLVYGPKAFYGDYGLGTGLGTGLGALNSLGGFGYGLGYGKFDKLAYGKLGYGKLGYGKLGYDKLGYDKLGYGLYKGNLGYGGFYDGGFYGGL